MKGQVSVCEENPCVWGGGGAEGTKELIRILITHFPQNYHRNHTDAFMTEHPEPSYLLQVLLVPLSTGMLRVKPHCEVYELHVAQW